MNKCPKSHDGNMETPISSSIVKSPPRTTFMIRSDKNPFEKNNNLYANMNVQYESDYSHGEVEDDKDDEIIEPMI